MRTRILLADDHVVVREGLRNLLVREGFDVVAEASDGHAAVRQAREQTIEIAILDIFMPLLNGLDTAREILKTSPITKVILLTMYKEEQYVLEALRAGVSGYVLKSQAGENLVQAIHEVSKGSVYLSPVVTGTVVKAYLEGTESSEPLTPRERAVLQLISEGKSTKEIAQLLGLSVKTAESHRTNLMKKLDIHEIAGLVRYAIRLGLIQP